ncbi:hypothetical protein SBA3_330009 [Candidatus Sulfopaludibacter sp. SbA3]|nr:hypothetical protein SBA3_330009 [Candidatus Sulfopaludibacter sp. SbA3]
MYILFLGWKHPGPIEAAESGQVYLCGPHFWDGNIPAPLKRHRRGGSYRERLAFLGWKHPGPIEASRLA